MTPSGGATSSSLAKTLAFRLALTAVAVMILQAILVSWREYVNETDFLNSYVRREAVRLARLPLNAPTALGGDLGIQSPSQYRGPNASAYAFRVIAENGTVYAAHNVPLLDSIAAWTDRPTLRQDFWVRKFSATERMYVAGGMRAQHDGGNIWIELATSGDPDRTYLWTIASDIVDDITMPIIPLGLLGMFVTLYSVRRAFRPLVAAANHADAISVQEPGERIDVTGLPAEASQFASAVNRLLDRVNRLVSSQREFIGRAAHELRTPLSIVMLELGNLKDPSSKRLEADVRSMSGIVDQLLLLARLEATPKTGMAPVDVTTVVRELVNRMRLWVEKDGHLLKFTSLRETSITGDEASIREAVRNLIENAVKHTPPGTEINVEVTGDGSIVVEDAGPGLGTLSTEEIQQPFRKGSTTTDGAGLGLAIVRQAAELHGGSLEIGPSRLGGARFAFQFPRFRATAQAV